MAIDSWLPINFKFPDGSKSGKPKHGGNDWQIVEIEGGGQALLANKTIQKRWLSSGLIEVSSMVGFNFGHEELFMISSSPSQILSPVFDCRSPNSKNEALAFSLALKSTREFDSTSSLHDAIYIESISRILPTYGETVNVGDDVVLGSWLTGGVDISAKSLSKLSRVVSWMGDTSLKEVVSASGLVPLTNLEDNTTTEDSHKQDDHFVKKYSSSNPGIDTNEPFALPGRPFLEEFFNEHIIDLVRNKERYAALGVDFPSAVVLHGPPGCGKTFAIEKLIEFLGWPNYQIDASSVGSPYIHETSRKVAAVFEKAINNAPAVLVIDEMESFLADRESGAGSSQHRVEEVAEFLRRIPEAVQQHVLIVAMTNRIEMIDPAILRRGRFDHIIEVGPASEEEVKSLLDKLLEKLPQGSPIDTQLLAKKLAKRPLSDVSFVVREGARLAARAGLSFVEMTFLEKALASSPSRGNEPQNKMGFV
jgi:Cdc6-like AAA superfamily ATPase